MFKHILKFSTILFLVGMLPACSTIAKNETTKYKVVAQYVKNDVPRPTVIVLHGCNGVNDYGQSYFQWASKINSWGFNAIVLDSFSRRGYGNICNKEFYVMPFERSEDVLELAEEIRKQPWHKGNIGVIGFSHGGSTALNISGRQNQNQINFAIAFYPSCNHIFAGAHIIDMTIPTQMHLGEKDDWTPHTECMLQTKNVKNFVYKNATHAFDMNYPSRNYYGHWLAYSSSATTQATKHVQEFLSANRGN